MIAPRSIVITRDKPLGGSLRLALASAGLKASWVDSPRALEDGAIEVDLAVVQVRRQHDPILGEVMGRLPARSRVVALLPTTDLVTMVAVLRSDSRVASVLAIDTLRPADLTAMASRLLFGDVFGLEKVVPWGARINSSMIGSYAEKGAAVDRVLAFAEEMGVRRRQRQAIADCCDEMLMNAIYDAPALAHEASAQPTSDIWSRLALRADDRAVLEYACDAERFVLSVRDRWGTFRREALVDNLTRCLHSGRQILDEPSRSGGAGLGLYLMARSASSILFNVLPEVATECICTFDLTRGPKAALSQLGVFHERVEASGHVALRPPRAGRFPIERRRVAAPPPLSLARLDRPANDPPRVEPPLRRTPRASSTEPWSRSDTASDLEPTTAVRGTKTVATPF